MSTHPAISLERLSPEHADRFLDAVERSVQLHRKWVSPPRDRDTFLAMTRKYDGDRHVSFIALDSSGDPLACINVSEIVRGAFQSAYLGFYGFRPHAGKGLTRIALRAVVEQAFGPLGLHRLEANIQPDNARSIALVESLGFNLEGFSPRYLKIDGAWRDHMRYAITVEDTLLS